MWISLVRVLAKFGAEQSEAVCNRTLVILQRCGIVSACAWPPSLL